MSDAIHYRLHSPKQANDVMVKAWDWTKARLAMGSKRLVLEIRHETRSTRQNRLLHAMPCRGQTQKPGRSQSDPIR